MTMRKVLVFLVVTVTIWRACNAENCTKLNVQELMSCKPAVALKNPTNPSPACCKTVKSQNGEDIKCLCGFIKVYNGTWLRSFGIDPDRCVQLGPLCNISKPVNCLD
uniref:Bifunctional inhibitor/plant lipid transfer protein/seed storage helical domain-containing protein n=1 Tax=Chenopodium quinoa TaxID=63459 RepID=A0A803MFW4_CHEQI